MAILCCYQCKNRTIGCHSHCEKYLLAKEKHDALKEVIRKQQAADAVQIEEIMRTQDRFRKRTRRIPGR